MRELVHVNGGEAQSRVLAPCASHFLPQMLLERRARVQARDWVKSNRFQDLLWNSWRVHRQSRGLPSQTAERPLSIDEPSVEDENQTKRGPARLIGTNFVKI